MRESVQTSETRHTHRSVLLGAAVLAVLGTSLRLYILFVSGNSPVGPLSGGGDEVRYETLGENVFRGQGLTYAGQPTAFRPPVYPILLATAHWVFGSHYFLAMRVLQFFASLLLVFVCFKLTERLFCRNEGILAGAFALALPSLVYVENELQTEALAACLTSLFFLAALDLFEDQNRSPLVLGTYSGISALLRFNAALLVGLAGAGLLLRDRSAKRAALLGIVVALFVLPWLVRNEIVFQGRALYSTLGGVDLLEGVLRPEGRAQANEVLAVKGAVGWEHTDIETNAASRLRFPSEDILNSQARVAAGSAWRALDWTARIRLFASKVIRFWLSTDQLLSTTDFPKRQRYLRAGGVLIYWLILASAAIGWLRLFNTRSRVAVAIALYCIAITIAHLPFTMNTRLRVPLLDPLLVVLAAGGVGVVLSGRTTRAAQAPKLSIQF